MIKKLDRKPKIPKNVKKKIHKLDKSFGTIWDRESKFPEIKNFKDILKMQLFIIQDDKCSFCGLELNETSAAQIEHFAPKGGESRIKHPEFTFTLVNLTLACSLCNGFEKKGNTDTITNKNRDYVSSIFNMVHPYLDDPASHFSWKGSIISSLTQKGAKSIKVFQLDSTHMTDARTKLHNFQELGELSPEEIRLIKELRGTSPSL